MRISFPLVGGEPTERAKPGSVYYDAAKHTLVFHPLDTHDGGPSLQVDLTDYDFTLHSDIKAQAATRSLDCSLDWSQPLELYPTTALEAGIQLSTRQLVELIDEARGGGQ